MEAEKTDYFARLVANEPPEELRKYTDNLRPEHYPEYGRSYNEFIEFWTNQQYLNILEQIQTEVYDENTKKFKAHRIDELLNEYNKSNNIFRTVIDNFKNASYGFHRISDRQGATEDEKKASEMNTKYDPITSLIYEIRRAERNMNEQQTVNINDLRQGGLEME